MSIWQRVALKQNNSIRSTRSNPLATIIRPATHPSDSITPMPNEPLALNSRLVSIPLTLIVAASLLMFSALFSQNSFALSAQANLDRYLLAAKRYINSEEYDRASKYLHKAKELQLSLPADYHYYAAQVFDVKNRMKEAREEYELYVQKAGSEGEFYVQSLEKITEIEEVLTSREQVKQAFSKQNQLKKEAIQPSTPSANNNDSYVERLKALYLSNTAEDALIKHINMILAGNHYSGELIQNDSRTGIHYKVSIGSNNSIVVTRQDHRKQPALITTERTDVYGKNPFISHDCDVSKGTCWVKNPNNLGKWVEIRHDEKSALDLAKAFTNLVQTLQGKN